MCSINFWAVNAAAFMPEFQRFTVERIGAVPAVHDVGIVSCQVRSTSKVFTLHLRMCDRDSLIGRGNEAQHKDEASAEDWLGWLRELPDHAPHLSRISVLRAWSPNYVTTTPDRSRSIGIAEVNDTVLRDVGDEMLLTIDYPHTA